MKKFIFPIFMALFSGVAFGAAEPNCVQPGNLMDIPSNQTTGNGNRYIKSDDYLEETPRYLKCGQDNINDMKYCPHDAIVVDSERKVYKCTSGNVWSIVDNIRPCTEDSKTLIESGLKNNYRQAKKEGNNFVLFYNQTQGKYLLKYCLSQIEPFKRMEDKCNENGDLDSGICYKLTTISNNTATSPTKASDNIGLQNSEQTIPTDSLQETGDFETHEEFDSAAWRRDTENAYKHERDNAQSWANKGITAGSTLLTGEGAMKAAQALAEQKADRDAEIEMAEWISKMGCEYGNGQQVNLGKEETLPGGNELTQYYAEYKQLADKLKATKTALNLRPGIESEVLYDRAETGLYQYANAERQSGGFTSLSRALMNPEGTDAEQWNAQKAEVAKDLTTGTLLTAGGLVVGAAGNYLVNRNHEPTKLQQSIDKVVVEVEEKLPAFTYTPAPVNITYQEPKTEIYLGENGGRAPIPTLTELKPKQNALTLNGDTTFDRNKATLKDTTKINAFVDRLNTEVLATMTTDQEISINIIGHTDRTGNDKINIPLSLERARSVEKHIKERLPSNISNKIHYEPTGVGSKDCSKNYCDGKDDCELCRKVVVTIEDITKTQE